MCIKKLCYESVYNIMCMKTLKCFVTKFVPKADLLTACNTLVWQDYWLEGPTNIYRILRSTPVTLLFLYEGVSTTYLSLPVCIFHCCFIAPE